MMVLVQRPHIEDYSIYMTKNRLVLKETFYWIRISLKHLELRGISLFLLLKTTFLVWTPHDQIRSTSQEGPPFNRGTSKKRNKKGGPPSAWLRNGSKLILYPYPALLLSKRKFYSGEGDCLFSKKKLEADSTGKGLMAEIFTTLLFRIQ